MPAPHKRFFSGLFTQYLKKRLAERSLRIEWIERVLDEPCRVERQPCGRLRFWGYSRELDKYARVATLSNGETVLNAFPDRNFTRTHR